MCVLTVATLRRKALTLSVISGPAADPSTAEGRGADDLMVSSHGRKGLTQQPSTSEHTYEEKQHTLDTL